jgi:hypothetical protein
MRNRLALLAAGKENLPIYFHVGQEMMVDEPTVNALINEMRELQARFIVIDPLCDVHPGDENSAKDMSSVFRLLRKFTHAGITVLVIHHWRKGNGQYGDGDAVADEARGSSVIQGALNGHLSCRPAVKEADGSYTIHVTQSKLKDAEKMPPFKIRFMVKDGVASMDYIGEAAPARDEQIEKQILLFLAGADRWVAVTEILERKIAGEKKVRGLLQDLVRFGKLTSQTRKELTTQNIIPAATAGAHNEQYYRATKNE